MKKLILLICDKKFVGVLNETIQNLSSYAIKCEADLKIKYVESNYLHINRYHEILNTYGYDYVSYLDSDLLIHPNAPDIFKLTDGLSFVKPPSVNDYMRELIKNISPTVDLDLKYYVWAGVFCGRLDMLQNLAWKVIKLWDKTEKTNHFFYNDQVYLCQVLKSDYPNFRDLGYKFCVNKNYTMSGKEFYFGHSFGNNKVSDLKEMKSVL